MRGQRSLRAFLQGSRHRHARRKIRPHFVPFRDSLPTETSFASVFARKLTLAYSSSTVIRPARWWVSRRARPADDRLRTVLVRRQQREMHRAPGELRLQTGHRSPAEELHDRRAAADRRHRPLVAVRERLRVLAFDPACDRLARVLSRLERDRSELGQDLPGLRVRDRGDVADHVHLRMVGEREVRPDGDAVPPLRARSRATARARCPAARLPRRACAPSAPRRTSA